MRPKIVSFPDTSSLGQGQVRLPYLTPSQTAAQILRHQIQQQRPPVFLRPQRG